MLQKVPEIRAKTIRAFKRHIPTPLNLIVLVDIEKNVLEEIFDHAQIREHIKATEIIDSSQLSKVDPLPAGGALVVFGYLNDFSKARHINAQLRTIVPEGFVFYFSALTVANSAQHLADLKMFLTFGEHGRDTFTYDAAYSLMLPSQSEYVPAWQAELELLQQLRNEGSYPAEVEERLDLLVETQKRSTSLFWPGGSGELEIKNDFVFLNTTDDRASITQADIFATISNLLACSRMDNKGLTSAPLSGEQIKWQQSVYGQALLAPENFENYNDAVLRAAFLRAAHPSELQYFSDANASFQIFTLIKAQILGWSKGIGDSLPEFLISLATKRLALSAKHMSEIKTLLTGDELPSYIKVLASKI